MIECTPIFSPVIGCAPIKVIYLVGRVGSNSLPHRPSALPYCSAFSPGIRRADIRRTFSGYLSFPFVSLTTPNQKLYIGRISMQHPDIWLGSWLVLPYCSAFSPGIWRADIRRTFSGYLVRFLARPVPLQTLNVGWRQQRRRGHIQLNRRAKSKKRKSCLRNQRSGGRIYAGYPRRHGWDL